LLAKRVFLLSAAFAMAVLALKSRIKYTLHHLWLCNLCRRPYLQESSSPPPTLSGMTQQALRGENVSRTNEGVWGNGCIDPHCLDLGTGWRWMVSFTPLPLYPRGKSPRYPLDRRLGWPQSQSGRRGEEKILGPSGTRTPTPRSSSRSLRNDIQDMLLATGLNKILYCTTVNVRRFWFLYFDVRASQRVSSRCLTDPCKAHISKARFK
jgi:hypothetical protein